MLITFEGIEGSGKSTQCAWLGQWLESQGYQVVQSKEPGGTRLGAAIRSLLLNRDNRDLTGRGELFLYLADRAQHVSQCIKPSLQQGKLVLVDRFSDSTLAYQGYGRELPLEMLRGLNELATDGLRPDLTILIDLPAEEGLKRARRRNQEGHISEAEGRFEEEALDFHRRVRRGFLCLAEMEPDRIKQVDGCRSETQIQQEIKGLLEGFLGRPAGPDA